jgi:hypothetical protein
MPHVITQPCCNDASCIRVCPVNYTRRALHQPRSPLEMIAPLIAGRGANRIDADGWNRIDTAEKPAGRTQGRRRVKLVRIQDFRRCSCTLITHIALPQPLRSPPSFATHYRGKTATHLPARAPVQCARRFNLKLRFSPPCAAGWARDAFSRGSGSSRWRRSAPGDRAHQR